MIVSSHILPELADVCTRVGMIEKGNLIVDDYVQDVMRKAREALLLYVRVTENPDKAAALIEQHEGVAKVSMKGDMILVTLQKEVRRLQLPAQSAARSGLPAPPVPRRRRQPGNRLHETHQRHPAVIPSRRPHSPPAPARFLTSNNSFVCASS